MKTWKKRLTILFVACMIISALPTNVQAAGKSKIKLNKSKLTLNVGSTKTLKLKGTKKTPKWTSSKKNVATVTKKGKVKAKKKGSTIITAKLGKKKYKCKVTVKQTAASNQTPIVTPTEKPTTPTEKPITPTEKPSVTPDIDQALANKYQNLKSYLIKYGTYNSNTEDYFISNTTKDGSSSLFTEISYNLDGSFEFSVMLTSGGGIMANGGTEELFILTITPPEYTKGAVSNIFVYSSDFDMYYANGEVILSALTATNPSITYTSTNAPTEEISDSLYGLGESMLSLGLEYWNLLLKEDNAAPSLQDLGFTSYEG